MAKFCQWTVQSKQMPLMPLAFLFLGLLLTFPAFYFIMQSIDEEACFHWRKALCGVVFFVGGSYAVCLALIGFGF